MNLIIEPFDKFGEFLNRYAEERNIRVPSGVLLTSDWFPASDLAEIHRVAKELGVIYSDDGTVQLIKQ